MMDYTKPEDLLLVIMEKHRLFVYKIKLRVSKDYDLEFRFFDATRI